MFKLRLHATALLLSLAGTAAPAGCPDLSPAGTDDDGSTIRIGWLGAAGSMDIAGCGVSRTVCVIGGAGDPERGEVFLHSVGSALTVDELTMGLGSADATLFVGNGAGFGCRDTAGSFSTIGTASANRSVVTVQGTGSAWEQSGPLSIGLSGEGTFSVTEMATLDATARIQLGVNTGGVGILNLNAAGEMHATDAVFVGVAGSGTVNVNSSSELNATGPIEIGIEPTGTGTLSIEGGSLLTMTNQIDVGLRGTGTLQIEGGSLLETRARVEVGSSGGGVGTINVENTSMLVSTDDIRLGTPGTGTINVRGGGEVVTAADLSIGRHPGGVGELNVSDGGGVVNQTGIIAVDEGSTGTATVQGDGAFWANTGSLRIGGPATETGSGSGSLTISDGGNILIGNAATRSPSTALVISNDKGTGLGGNLALGSGCSITNAGFAAVGDGRGMFGSATVDPAGGGGGLWSNDGPLFVGANGATGVLTIDGGGTVSNTTGRVGSGTGASGIVTVSGGSVWSNSKNLFVGDSDGGTGNLTISDWAGVRVGNPSTHTAGRILVGSDTGSSDHGSLTIYAGSSVDLEGETLIGDAADEVGAVLVDGTDALWTVSSDLVVAVAGTGTLDLRNGARVFCGTASIAANPGSHGTTTISGTGSGLSSTGAMDVGGGPPGPGGTALLHIEGGSSVASGPVRVWDHGTLRISGGSFTASSGLDTQGGTLIHSGGSLTVRGDAFSMATNAFLGNDDVLAIGTDPGDSPELTLGIGSSWTTPIDQLVAVGYEGQAALHITTGADIVCESAGVIGARPTAVGEVTLDGNGSTWTTADLSVGHEGTGTLSITNRGLVRCESGMIGRHAGSHGEVHVSGPGSVWRLFGGLAVGGDGDAPGGGAVLNVAGGSVTVFGPAKVWPDQTVTLNTGSIESHQGFDAREGHLEFIDGTLRVDGGAFAMAANATEGTDDYQAIGRIPGNTPELILGAGANWTIPEGERTAIGFGGPGSLAIVEGAVVSSEDSGSIGRADHSHGVVTVGGAGSAWNVAGDLVVGGDPDGPGGSGTLSVTGQGLVAIGDRLTLGSAGHITIGGGSLVAQALDHTRGGVLEFLDGTLAVQRFEGDLHQAGGTLSTLAPRTLTTIAEADDATGGDYTLGNDGTVEIRIGGPNPADYDRLQIEGDFVAGGTISVTLIDGYLPPHGKRFRVFRFLGAASGSPTIELDQTLTDLGVDTTQLLTLGVIKIGCPVAGNSPRGGCTIACFGDQNDDGALDLDDVVLFSGAFTVNDIDGGADLNGDGLLSLEDVVLLVEAFGAGCP